MTPAQPFDLVVLGDCNPDVLVGGPDVTPAFGQAEKLVERIALVAGGSASITAIAAARLGLRVALVAAVGADPAGSFMLAELAAAGVDTTAILVRPGTPTAMTVALTRGADRAILTATGAVTTLTAADVPECLLRLARHVHVSSYFLVEQSLGPGLPDLLAAARAAGATVSLDTNWDPSGRWADDRLRAVMAQCDLLLPNEAEALHLTGAPDLAAAVDALTAGGARAVVKLGAAGALCADGPSRYQVRLPPLTPADTTGAGDCFNAGLLTGLLTGLDLPRAAALGCAAGAASTQALGGTAAAPDLPAAQSLATRVTITRTAGWGEPPETLAVQPDPQTRADLAEAAQAAERGDFTTEDKMQAILDARLRRSGER
jgi:sugar/nucleoside kinase (ribokinase family)